MNGERGDHPPPVKQAVEQPVKQPVKQPVEQPDSANPYQSPESDEIARRLVRPVPPMGSVRAHAILIGVCLISGVVGWFLLCCGLGYYYGDGLLAPLIKASPRQHFLSGLPPAIAIGVIGSVGLAIGIVRSRARRAAEYRNQQLLD